MPRHEWTPEQRKAAGERLKLARAVKRVAKEKAAEVMEILNPIATDVIAPTPVLKSKPKPAVQLDPAAILKVYKFATSDIIHQLEHIPLDSVSYSDCGILLNALSACSTAVALARRQKQEQLDAGTHRAPCKTCGRMIDISKAGGFQILTERDEFHMPRNSYYCSQNCLLARNMPSHAKQTSKEKKENRA